MNKIPKNVKKAKHKVMVGEDKLKKKNPKKSLQKTKKGKFTKKMGLKKRSNFDRSAGLSIDHSGSTTERNAIKDKDLSTIYRNVLGYNRLEEKERELVSDLFGTDVHESGINISEPDDPAIKSESDDDDWGEEMTELIPVVPDKDVRKPAWMDDDDVDIRVKDDGQQVQGEGKKSSKKYENILREKYTNLMGDTPEWANLSNKPDTNSSTDDSIARKAGNYLSTNATTKLPKTNLVYKKLMALNQAAFSRGNVAAIEFNPHFQVSLVATNSHNNGSATLFQVDGQQNHKIQAMKFPRFPVNCAKFLNDGKRFVIGSNLYGHFFVYDMEAGKETKIPWNPSEERQSMSQFVLSPDGDYLVFLGSRSLLHIFDTKTMTHIESLQAPAKVRSATFNTDGTRMYTHGDGGDVLVWDMNARLCVQKFYDDGCIMGTSIAMSPNNQYLACGSSSGIVNIYDGADLSSPQPSPIKVLDKLTTSISSMTFNATSEILAMASSSKDDALKLAHFPSMTHFADFFDRKEKHRIQVLQFSPKGGYLALGNNKGTAFLYRLKHFSSY